MTKPAILLCNLRKPAHVTFVRSSPWIRALRLVAIATDYE